MNYSINLGAWKSVFAVPSAVVDDYILLASSAAIKTLLYLLRHGGDSFSEKQIAKELRLSEDAVTDALVFWEQAGLLAQNGGEFSPPAAESPSFGFIAEKKDNDIKISPANAVNIKDKTNALTPKEIASRLEQSSEVKFLFDEAQKIFGRPLNHTEQRGLISIHDYIGMSTDIILILINYCRSIDRLSVRYAESVAASWSDMGIKTHRQAEDYIAVLKQQNQSFARIKKMFGIERNLNTREKEFITKWTEQYKMSFEMIEEAYSIMCNKTARISFVYVDKILLSWREKGVKTPEDVKKERESFNSVSKKENDNPSYDLEKYEEYVLKNTPKG